LQWRKLPAVKLLASIPIPCLAGKQDAYPTPFFRFDRYYRAGLYRLVHASKRPIYGS
jgi:hypothetical protein